MSQHNETPSHDAAQTEPTPEAQAAVISQQMYGLIKMLSDAYRQMRQQMQHQGLIYSPTGMASLDLPAGTLEAADHVRQYLDVLHAEQDAPEETPTLEATPESSITQGRTP